MTKPSTTRLPATEAQRRQIRLLSGCTFQPASWDKRFVRDLAGAEYAARQKGEALTLTDGQAEWLDKLTHKYRRQHGRCPCLECLKAATPNPHDRSLFGEGERL